MLAQRGSNALRPKLSLSINTASSQAAAASKRPSLALNLPSPVAMTVPLRSPISPSPISPTARNTRLNQRGYSTLQQPSYRYNNSLPAGKQGILKKASSGAQAKKGDVVRRLQFRDEPTVHSITPIENEEEYYGAYAKMTREERKWTRR